ncbi:MAG: hypothetical protein PVI57_15120 [Gemmatimonadota bacterium]|jgi:hypothetical protein
MVTCGLCGHEFPEDRSQRACRACPLGADCGWVRCPACGYENPRDPAWLEALRGWLGSGGAGGGDPVGTPGAGGASGSADDAPSGEEVP